MSRPRRRLNPDFIQDDYENREGPTRGTSAVNWRALSNKTRPEFYKPTEGAQSFDIIPYEIRTKLHPRVHAGSGVPGDIDWSLDVFVHRRIGAGLTTVLCPKRNYGKPCPICDEVSKLYDAGDSDAAKQIQATRRLFLNVKPHDKKGPTDEVQVFEVSYYLFGKELLEEARACSDGELPVNFADMGEGMTVRFRMEEEDLGRNKVPRFKSFRFVERDGYQITEDDVQQTYSFDEGLELLTYEAIEGLLFGGDFEEPKQEEAPRSMRSRKDEEEEYTPKRTRLRDVEEDEEEAPKQNKRSRPVEDPEDFVASIEDDTDIVEEVKNSKRMREASREPQERCPYGHEWGSEGEHRECDDCDGKTWKACARASK